MTSQKWTGKRREISFRLIAGVTSSRRDVIRSWTKTPSPPVPHTVPHPPISPTPGSLSPLPRLPC